MNLEYKRVDGTRRTGEKMGPGEPGRRQDPENQGKDGIWRTREKTVLGEPGRRKNQGEDRPGKPGSRRDPKNKGEDPENQEEEGWTQRTR